MKDNKDFFSWYKTKITQDQQDPPEDAWKNISDELDINDVWDKVAVKLDADGGWFTQKSLYYAVPVLLLLLLSGSIYFHLDQKNKTSLASSEVTVAGDDSLPRVADGGPKSADEKVETIPADAEADAPTGSPDEANSVTSSADRDEEKGSHPAEAANADENKTASRDNADENKAGSEEDVDENQTGTRKDDTPSESFVAENDLPNSARPQHPVKDNDHATNLQHLIPGALPTRAEAPSDASGEPGADIRDERSGNAIREDREQPLITSKHAARATVRPLVLADSMLTVSTYPVTLHPADMVNVPPQQDQPEAIHSRSIEFGITASAKNTWLLNTTTFRGLEKHTLNSTVPDFGKDIGLVFCFNFSPKFSAQAEGMFVSEMGQRYNEYRNGKYVHREIDLQYYTLNLLLKYSRNRVVHGQSLNAHGIVGGIYARALNNATQTINGQTMATPTYSRHDYGMILGYEYNRYLFTNLVITSGLRVNYGFPDIDINSWSRTATGSFDLNIAVRYKIGL